MDLSLSFFRFNLFKSEAKDTTGVESTVDTTFDVKSIPQQDTSKSIFTGCFPQPSVESTRVVDKKYGHFKYNEAPASELVKVNARKKEYLHKDAAPKFNQMVADAKEDGVNLVLLSGMRSVKHQKEVFQRKQQKPEERAKISAPPGYSEHHTGYAIDLNKLDSSFEKTKEFKWLEKNAGKYGFEMSFPKDNSQGVNYEPWHWRYVGDEKSQQAFSVAREQNPQATRISLNVLN